MTWACLSGRAMTTDERTRDQGDLPRVYVEQGCRECGCQLEGQLGYLVGNGWRHSREDGCLRALGARIRRLEEQVAERESLDGGNDHGRDTGVGGEVREAAKPDGLEPHPLQVKWRS